MTIEGTPAKLALSGTEGACSTTNLHCHRERSMRFAKRISCGVERSPAQPAPLRCESGNSPSALDGACEVYGKNSLLAPLKGRAEPGSFDLARQSASRTALLRSG